MTTIEVRGLPVAEVIRYLEELGGRADGNAFRGDSWTATVTEGTPAAVGSLHVRVLHVAIEGERAAAVVAHLRRKTMRGGG